MSFLESKKSQGDAAENVSKNQNSNSIITQQAYLIESGKSSKLAINR